MAFTSRGHRVNEGDRYLVSPFPAACPGVEADYVALVGRHDYPYSTPLRYGSRRYVIPGPRFGLPFNIQRLSVNGSKSVPHRFAIHGGAILRNANRFPGDAIEMLYFLSGRSVNDIEPSIRNGNEYLAFGFHWPYSGRGVHPGRLGASPYPLERACRRVQ